MNAPFPHRVPETACPSWDEYENASASRKSEIEIKWCAIGHGYQSGDRETAFKNYCRAISLRELPRKHRADTVYDHLEYETNSDGQIVEVYNEHKQSGL